MLQKIIIPKGTIDSAHTTIIEIPNYLHETSTVVVTNPKIADSALEETWEVNQYAEDETGTSNEGNWEQNYEAVTNEEEGEYPAEDQEEYSSYQYEQPNEETEVDAEAQEQVEEPEPTYVAEEVQTRTPNINSYTAYMRKCMLDKRKELQRLKEQRQRVLEGEMASYRTDTQDDEVATQNLSEVPENMRGRSAYREHSPEKEMRRQQEFERYQPPVSPQMYPHYQQGAYSSEQSAGKYVPQERSQTYISVNQDNQQWNPEYATQVQYPRLMSPRPKVNYQRRQMSPQPANFSGEDSRQYQKARRKPTFSLPSN